MSKAELISKLLKLDPRLATSALKNDRLTARLKVQALLKELNMQVLHGPPDLRRDPS